MTPKKSKGLITYLLLIVIAVFCLVFISSRLNADADKTEYTTVISYFDEKKVSEYTLDLGTGDLTYKLQGDDTEKHYTVPNVNIFLEDTENYRQEYNKANPDAPLVQDYIKITDRTWLYSLIPVLLTIILGIAILYFMMKQSGGGGKYTTFGKANLKNGASARKATFKDVAGADEEKQELVEIVDYLKNPKKYTELGAKVPKGVLLLGPPGTGKTLLARAVAGEAGCPFFPISGSDFVEMFVGVGASRVRDLFEQAKKHAPAIIFIDEIDAVGRHRGAGLGGGHDEREQTLNQLLVEMDGFTGNESVIVIAATNRRDILDPALLRPGRFDRQIVVGYPDVKGREEILRVHAKNKPLGPDVDIKRIARTTQGFTGADLENVLNEAALLAARSERRAITEADIEEATLKVIAGPEKKSRIVTEHDRKVTAYHEAGHAVASYNLPTQDKVHQVTIIQRGMAAGLTIYRPDTDDQHVSRNQMRERIISLLGGRCAEEIFLDDICTGASNDIERATATARNMVTKYGFSSKLGTVTYGSDNDEVFLGKDYGHTKNYSESVAAQIDEEVRSIIEKAYSDCVEILRANADKMHFLAKYLLKYEKIDGDDFEKLMKGEISEAVLSDDEVGAPLGFGDTPEPELN
ncbi:MAG: ATP-dependent zinc metalloprotease FtsH [Ruminococcus sp.]|uniref:ATP-dependent zinc metalloprotease FtsH n=2 Tax=Ruminococcus sp. TaxID=41978 RepID=UPI0025E2C65E|nr:ATP-dependent zinc metalloprotease FtsH [Ruminococcus sp.]MBQ6033961.1 ATP-dependent zinc metalloprotease FtsH [Ruminococcus sp.]MBR0512181.1 ATP-dependent zinc metalloprotease FtsH [Ruminococcus sp.]MBR6995970.1 ATP-dependent zinc metalloprotease FtsH [Ruminococcus sp.]